MIAPVDDLTVHALEGEDERCAGWDLDATAGLRARSADADRDLFIGVASTTQVRSFLRGVAFDEVRDVEFEPFHVSYLAHYGDRSAKPPASEGFWFAAENADVDGALKFDLFPLMVGFLVGGAVAGIIGIGLLTFGFRADRPAAADDFTTALFASAGTYPARLDASLDEPLHRWTWRVTYYAFVLGTDRYPPFSLAPDPQYTYDFAVGYPLRLSRGLVPVKWWLLAFPHFVLLAVFGQGLGWDGGRWTDRPGFSIGIVGLLVLISAAALLFRGRYPKGLYDVVTGLMRWTYRVYAYLALMRDEYPPFRLDAGGREPGTVEPTPGSDTDPSKELIAP